MLTHLEKQKLHGLRGSYSIFHWRSYLSFILGRPVDLVETEDFLQEESERQFGKPKYEDTWAALERNPNVGFTWRP